MNLRSLNICLFIILLLAGACSTKKKSSEQVSLVQDSIKNYYAEPYRPQYHFSPPKNWTNDPNGLVYYQGEFHLFYQYNPYDKVWGHMTWGHAISNDLFHWKNLPPAIHEDGAEMIFSGSAVIDKGNTSGLCQQDSTDCMVAIYTSHISGDPTQQYQSLAFSSDAGRTFTKYAENPVLDLGMENFRDPHVFWYDRSKEWVMAVSQPTNYKVQFYGSKNLTQWDLLGEFGNQGDVSKIWECPNLVEVGVDGQEHHSKWVLIISSGSPYDDKYVGMQYFIGDFDGKTFTPSGSAEEPKWLDYGKDYYAAITYNNLPDGQKPILLGWALNWAYANDIPTSPWRGSMALPRYLSVSDSDNIWQLIQTPILPTRDDKNVIGVQSTNIFDVNAKLNSLESGSRMIKLHLENKNAGQAGIKVFKGDDEETLIGYDYTSKKLFIDRTRSGNVSFNKTFPSREEAPLEIKNNQLDLTIFLDQSIIEVFAENGIRVMTERVFPTNKKQGMEMFAEGGGMAGIELETWPIPSVWR